MDDPTNDVVQLEHDFWVVGGGNPEFWQEHCAEDAIIALPMGIMGKAQTVEAMGASAGWESVEMDDVHTVRSSDTVSVAYQAIGRPREGDDYSAVVSSVYVRRGGRWLLLLHQQSPMT